MTTAFANPDNRATGKRTKRPVADGRPPCFVAVI